MGIEFDMNSEGPLAWPGTNTGRSAVILRLTRIGVPLSGPIDQATISNAEALKAGCRSHLLPGPRPSRHETRLSVCFPLQMCGLPSSRRRIRRLDSIFLRPRWRPGIPHYRGSKTTMTCTSDYAIGEVLDMRSAARVDPVRSSAPPNTGVGDPLGTVDLPGPHTDICTPGPI